MSNPISSRLLSDQSVLVTGASAGIGISFAEELARRGAKDLVLVARRAERLGSVKDQILCGGFRGGIYVFPCDLRLESDREILKQKIDLAGIEIDLLINNAGYGYVGKFLADDPKNQREMVETNCVAPLHLAQLFLPGMQQRKFGGIINIASVAAYPPLPYMATYGATKAFLLNWSVALNQELKKDRISVLAVCPGPTESDFHLVAGVEHKMNIVHGMTAAAVVNSSLESYLNGECIVVPGIQNVLLTGLTRFLPKKWLAQLGEFALKSRVPSSRL